VAEVLSSWNDGAARRAIIDFVEDVCGVDGVPVEERIAVFDNDGTLWCEKPMPIQLDFILRRIAAMAAADPALVERQPWKAVAEHDIGWFSKVMDDHYQGDDTNVRTLAGGILAAFAGISIEEFEAQANEFIRTSRHPTLSRGYVECGYAPMIELLAYLASNGFTNYIASGGGRDFMRPISHDMYGIDRAHVIGSSSTFAYTSDGSHGTITHQPAADYLNDGPEKPVRIWNRVGRRPILAAGNSNGDIEMLEFTNHPDRRSLRLLIVHDDAEREFDYVTGAERALDRARTDGWTTVSMNNDWTTIF
jgi:phosphoglycolate phosphatase-like HAD superfamily hydrolase